jgi:phosphoglycerol transferase MdoB-like AlkP superfamily enzyme
MVVALGMVISLLLGPWTTSQLQTQGLHRNALAILVTTALPRIAALELSGSWRRSPFGSPRAEDLTRFRGAAAGRNVVIVHLESTAARRLRPYGAEQDPMPSLSLRCQEALVFENAYTAYPETIKSFFAVGCSTFPALDTTPPMYEKVSAPGLASVLAEKGYRTGLFHSGRFAYLGMESVLRNRGYDTLEDAGDIGGDRQSSFGIDEPSTVRRILSWIDKLPAGQRFLVSYLPIAGHHPYDTPEPGPFPETDDLNRYCNALHYADGALAQLLEGLRARHLDRNTLFIFLGDHGEAFGEHAGNHGHTLFIYEENLRVPLILMAPGVFQESLRIQRVASLVDTAPTVLDLLGLAVPSSYQGQSLLEPQSGLALFCTDYTLGLIGLRDGSWKLIHELESDHSELYDLTNDPQERNNIATSFPERTEAYRDHLLRWAAAQKYRILRGRSD